MSKRIVEELAWLRMLFALWVVLDAPLAVWIVRHYTSASAGLLTLAIVVALVLSVGIVWIAAMALILLRRLGDSS